MIQAGDTADEKETEKTQAEKHACSADAPSPQAGRASRQEKRGPAAGMPGEGATGRMSCATVA